MKESKEKIKSRMIKNASRTWGYHDTEAESAFDPLVGMLMGALAFELEQISGEIQNTESRVVERLVELLTPDPVVGAYPSHGILTAQPHQPVFEIQPGTQFYFSRKVKNAVDPARTEQQNVFFTPAGRYRLFNGKVKYIATEKTLYGIDKEGYKEAVSESGGLLGREMNKLWIGIEPGSDLPAFDGLSLFFDLRSEHHEDTFYHSLARANWFLNDIPVTFAGGFGNRENAPGKEEEELLSLNKDTTAKVFNHVNNFYSRKFMTLADGKPVRDFTLKENYPPSLLRAYNEDVLAEVKIPCTWIRVEFLQPLPADMIENIYCSLNCFPVVNRKLNKFTYSARDQVTIIPLKAENSFFDMESVSNSKGVKYLLKSFSRIKEMERGSYILRQGGVGRFDSRNAVEILNYLLELLRDENAAFSILGTDMVSSNLREMNQIIARIEQRLMETSIQKENISYIMLRAQPNEENVFVEFWSTDGSSANNVKPGTPLTLFSGSDIRKESVRFLTVTAGGRDKMDTEDRLNAYRKALLSKGRIVTAEDIKALCYVHFGKNLEKVEVTKGIAAGTTADTGFVRTIDIRITLSRKGLPLTEDEIKYLKEDLKVRLEETSMNILPYRIFIG
jgi:hypothetical protein